MMKWWPFRRKVAKADASVSQEPTGFDATEEAVVAPADVHEAQSRLDPLSQGETPTDVADATVAVHSAAALETEASVEISAAQVQDPVALSLAGEPPQPDDSTAVLGSQPELEQEQAQGKRARAAAAVRKAISKLKRNPAGTLHKTVSLPVRVIIGYLPEVNERDAREYAQGMAEKHFDQMGIAFFQAFKHANGYAFEAHEGGPGKAYLPSIIEHFDAQGPYRLGENHSVVIRTATRMVEVQRLRDGLASIVLPESSEVAATEWLHASKGMIPGLNRRTLFFYAGAAVFATGVLSMLLSATVFRLQMHEDAPPIKLESISANNLPRAQWSRVEALPPNSYVRAIRFRNDKWEAPEIVTETVPAPAAPVATDGAKKP